MNRFEYRAQQEERIAREVDARYDLIDDLLTRRVLGQSTYDSWAHEIEQWAHREYAAMRQRADAFPIHEEHSTDARHHPL